MFVKKNLDFLLCFLYISTDGSSHNPLETYDQHEAFAPIFYPAFGDEVRTAAGNTRSKILAE